jgi:sialidase-1
MLNRVRGWSLLVGVSLLGTTVAMLTGCSGGSQPAEKVVVSLGSDEDLQVMACPAAAGNIRNSEGSIVALKDGRLLLAYSRFGGGGGDDSTADIAGKTSADGGRTWSKSFVIQRNDGVRNVMVGSLARLQSGRIGLCYARKNSESDCALYWRTSANEGGTWSAEVRVSPAWGYGGTGPDAVVQLSSGRVIVPGYRTANWQLEWHFTGQVCYSDDEGKTWQYAQPIEVPGGRTCEEPAVVELKDGRLLMYIRTHIGPIFQCLSSDQGATWSVPRPTTLAHPTSPMQLRRLPSTGDLVCVWNNSLQHRYPLTSAISRDEGQTWENYRDLEVETPGVLQICYPSLTFHEGRALMTYGVYRDDWTSLKFRNLPESWFYGPQQPASGS